jgi:PPIC-type PPIASE domain
VMNMRFLDATSTASDDELFVQALDLGMQRHDVVVRRRLVQIMRLSIEDGADERPVREEELQAMFEERKTELAIPARWRFNHVYFGRDRRGAAVQAAAAAALTRLDSDTPFDAAQRLGDPFLAGHRLPLLTGTQIDGDFGAGFAAALAACVPRRWCGPLSSSFGLHLVLIEEALAPRVPKIDEPEVQKRLLADVLRQRGDALMEQALAAMRRKYRVAS